MSGYRIVASIAVVAGLFPASALACSCMPMTRAEMLAAADLAFRGEVVSLWLSEDRQTIFAKVIPSGDFKGHAPPSVTVNTNSHTTMCGYPLDLGRAYDFAGILENGDVMAISQCSMVPMNHVEVPR